MLFSIRRPGLVLSSLAILVSTACLSMNSFALQQADAQSRRDYYVPPPKGYPQPATRTTSDSSPQIIDPAVQQSPVSVYDNRSIQDPAPQDEQPSESDAEADAAAKGQAALAKKIGSAHKVLFYDNDFSYLNDPNYDGWHLGDALKRMTLPNCGFLDIGGQYRARAHFESNHRGLGLTGVDDQFLLHRVRLYGNLQLNPNIRIYGEMLDAESNYENFGPRPIEVNRFEMQNLFVDLRLLSNCCRDLSVRIGRQEFLFGDQRVISPLDWANTRRTFEGVRTTWKRGGTTVDGFWANPMRIDDSSLDSPDRDQEFMGIYATRNVAEGQTLDVYALRHLNGRGTNNFKYNTIGVRAKGSRNEMLYDFEGAFQFGDNTDGSDHGAGMLTMGIGKKIACACWDPAIWLYYDYASGDSDLGAGNGFHHVFPLAHKYNGFMDLFGRRNIEDINVLFTMQPTQRLKLLTWYHYLFLATQSDSPYNVNMTAFNGGNAPGSPELGHEIDFVASYKIGARQNFVLGYSHFFSGNYYSTTTGVPYNGDANFWYTQWAINF